MRDARHDPRARRAVGSCALALLALGGCSLTRDFSRFREVDGGPSLDGSLVDATWPTACSEGRLDCDGVAGCETVVDHAHCGCAVTCAPDERCVTGDGLDDAPRCERVGVTSAVVLAGATLLAAEGDGVGEALVIAVRLRAPLTIDGWTIDPAEGAEALFAYRIDEGGSLALHWAQQLPSELHVAGLGVRRDGSLVLAAECAGSVRLPGMASTSADVTCGAHGAVVATYDVEGALAGQPIVAIASARAEGAVRVVAIDVVDDTGAWIAVAHVLASTQPNASSETYELVRSTGTTSASAPAIARGFVDVTGALTLRGIALTASEAVVVGALEGPATIDGEALAPTGAAPQPLYLAFHSTESLQPSRVVTWPTTGVFRATDGLDDGHFATLGAAEPGGSGELALDAFHGAALLALHAADGTVLDAIASDALGAGLAPIGVRFGADALVTAWSDGSGGVVTAHEVEADELRYAWGYRLPAPPSHVFGASGRSGAHAIAAVPFTTTLDLGDLVIAPSPSAPDLALIVHALP